LAAIAVSFINLAYRPFTEAMATGGSQQNSCPYRVSKGHQVTIKWSRTFLASTVGSDERSIWGLSCEIIRTDPLMRGQRLLDDYAYHRDFFCIEDPRYL